MVSELTYSGCASLHMKPCSGYSVPLSEGVTHRGVCRNFGDCVSVDCFQFWKQISFYLYYGNTMSIYRMEQVLLMEGHNSILKISHL